MIMNLSLAIFAVTINPSTARNHKKHLQKYVSKKLINNTANSIVIRTVCRPRVKQYILCDTVLEANIAGMVKARSIRHRHVVIVSTTVQDTSTPNNRSRSTTEGTSSARFRSAEWVAHTIDYRAHAYRKYDSSPTLHNKIRCTI